jgi:hypothetical protein
MKLNERHMLFIGEAVAACAEHGITMTLSAAEKVKQPGEDLGCSGFFLATEKLFSVGMGKPVEEWFPVMLHEFGHLEQWLENPEQCVKDDGLLDGLFWPWLERKRELEPDQVRALTNLALSYELDCERRTAWRLHEEPEFGISYSDYIKRANTYLYLYPLIAKHRKWCDVTPPYKVPELIAISPDKFIGEVGDYWDVPEEIERLVIDKCFPKEDA